MSYTIESVSIICLVLASHDHARIIYRLARGPRRLLEESNVQRIEALVHALHCCDLSPASGSRHLILRLRQESQARLVTTRFVLGVPDPDDLPGLDRASAIEVVLHWRRK